jgi:hypothetical protein
MGRRFKLFLERWSWVGEFFKLKSAYNGELSLSNVYKVAIKRKDVIKNTGDMCVAKGLYLAT